MEFLCHYLATHLECENLVYCLGMDADASELKTFLSMRTPKKLLLCLEAIEKEEFSASLEGIGRVDIDFVEAKDILSRKDLSEFTLVLDRFEDEGVLSSLALSGFKAMVAFMGEGYDSFHLWERFYLHTKSIVIARYVNPYRNEILDWHDDYEKELSVIFPVYNVAPYLEKCLSSVTAWKAPYVEFLFVDDGSTDNSAQILREFALKDPRIKLLSKENGGCASARQYGLERAKGRYIGFVDPDDFVKGSMFVKLLSRAFSGSYDIAYSGYNEYYEDTGLSEPIEDLLGWPYDCGVTDEAFIDELIAFRRIAIWRGIYASSLLSTNRLGFYTDIKRFDDLPFKVETIARARSVVSVPEYLYYYRLGRKGQDVSANDERLYVHFDIFARLDAFFASPRSSRQLALYRIVKTQTHAWALTRLKPELRDDYREKAARDIGIPNTKKAWKKLIKGYGGKKAVKEFMATYQRP